MGDLFHVGAARETHLHIEGIPDFPSGGVKQTARAVAHNDMLPIALRLLAGDNQQTGVFILVFVGGAGTMPAHGGMPLASVVGEDGTHVNGVVKGGVGLGIGEVGDQRGGLVQLRGWAWRWGGSSGH